MSSEYTGFGGGYDADTYTPNNDTYTFAHTRQTIVKGSVVTPKQPLTSETPLKDESGGSGGSGDSMLESTINEHIGGFVGLTVKAIKDKGEEAFEELLTKAIKDEPIMNKYAHLAKTSYDNYEGNDPMKALRESGFGEFEPVDELNINADNFVVESGEEVHLNFRGTMNMDDWLDKNTRILSEDLFGEMEKTARFKEAESQVIEAMKYADSVGKELTLSGHSLGGWFSYYFAKKFNLKGYHFNAAISSKQASALLKETAVEGVAEQTIYRTHTDLPSANTVLNHHKFAKSKTVKVKNIESKVGMDESLVEVHSIEQFTTNTSGVRNTTGASVFKSLKSGGKGIGKTLIKRGGTVLGVGVAAFSEYTDVSEDIKNNDNTVDKVDDSVIDTIKNVAVLGASGAIATALGPELIIPTMLAGFYVSLAGEVAARNLKKNTKESVAVLKNAVETGKDVKGDNIKSKIGSSIKQKNEEWEHRFSSAGKSIKHFFHL